MKLKKIAAVCCSLFLGFGLAASSSQCYDWYFKQMPNEMQPRAMPEVSSFFSKYDAFFVGKGEQKIIYLTFDAGYDNGNCAPILDTLKAQAVKAAFFVDGNFIRRNPELCKRIIDEGHFLCNHSLRHPDMTKLTNFTDYEFQIRAWEELAKLATGKQPHKYFRPPMGKFSELSLEYDRKLGYKTIFWSVAYMDWNVNQQPSHDYAMKKLMSRIHPGAVVLLHSTSKTNNEILAGFIGELKALGYRFGTLDELTANIIPQ